MISRRHSRDQQGFAVLELSLVAVIVLALGAIGFYVYSSSNKTKNTLLSADSSLSVKTDNNPIINSATAHWKQFQSISRTYSIKLIDGWKFTVQNGDSLYASCGAATTQPNCDFQAGTMAMVTVDNGGKDGIIGLSVSDGKTSTYTVSGTKVGTIQASNVTGDKYTSPPTPDPSGAIGPPKGTVTTSYVFPASGGKQVVISYDLVPGAKDQTSEVEEMVSTLNVN